MATDVTGMKIAVLMGGPGSERKVSLKSGEGVVAALRSLGADVTPVDVTGPGFTLPAGTQIAFNVIHGSELAIDKIASKRRFVERGVPTPRFEVIRKGASPNLPLPLVIKAPKEG